MKNNLRLPGCSPTPLAHYLKALGVLRLLSEQLPVQAERPRGSWQGETFVLHTTLDRDGLEQFFLSVYQPTPILAPWNGGSGFFQDDSQSGIEPLGQSEALRFVDYRQAIHAGRAALSRVGLTEKPGNSAKDHFLMTCRGFFSERPLAWLDAAVVLTGGSPRFPPLLGTGGNDGRLDFANNFMQRLVELFDTKSGSPSENCHPLLRGSLFGETTRGLIDRAIGQFFPQAAGGANATSGFDAKSLVNPWDYVLMLEGALLFGAAAVKRLESTGPGELAYPFSVRPSGFGDASASEADPAARFELWAPLWDRPTSLTELRHVLGEGRAQLRGRAARDGFEFTRAISCLGVDRGLSAFQRYSFARRNGESFFATPLDRVPVCRRPRASRVLDELDQSDWLERVRSASRGDRVPNRVASAIQALEKVALGLLRAGQIGDEERDMVEGLLLAVADAELAIAQSVRWAKEKRLRPLPGLGTIWWHHLGRGLDPELDLAAGLASLPRFRWHWEPIEGDPKSPVWNENGREVLWHDARLVTSMLAVCQRRIVKNMDGDDGGSLPARYQVRPSSLVRFLDSRTDDRRLARLARALSLVELPRTAEACSSDSRGDDYRHDCGKLPALHVLPRLALNGLAPPDFSERMPRPAAILRRGASGDGGAATRLAVQRLRGSGFNPAVREVPAQGELVVRALAGTLFPVSREVLRTLAKQFRPLGSRD